MSPEAGANVLAILRDVARRVPDRPALVMEYGQISFAALWERIDRASVGLRRRGMNPGDRAIVLIPMSIDLYVVLLALLKIGAVAVFVDPWIGRRQIAAFAAFAEPRAFLGIPRSHLLRWIEPGLRSLPLTVTPGRRFGPLPAGTTLAELEAEPGDGWIHPAAPQESALITFTSGSSGEPKGADRTHGFLLAQHRALAAEFPARPDDVDMAMFPVFALNNLAVGVPTVVPAMDFRKVEAVEPGRNLRQMKAHGVTTCTASPPFFDRLAADPESGKLRLRRVLTGGAPVADGQLILWQGAFGKAEILVAYGSTEAEPVAHISAEERLAAASPVRPQTPGFCAGPPIDRIRARVIRIHPGLVELGEGGWAAWELPAGEIGELVVAGEHVCKSYYRNPEAVRENKIVAPDGEVWHRMGDTGYFDAEGRFWLCGRVHSTIRRAGEWVHPQLVEPAARKGDLRVWRVAAVGLPDPDLGEKVVVVVQVLKDVGTETLERDVRARLADAGLPVDEVRVTREPLPVDPRHNSKIDYGLLREMLRR
ncbi:MAG TPA: AMP-binding protein [Thermoanaerobaculia bacterium]|nr:AMP-binding protein [Thermoanaerobaculia bacterium]